MKENNQKGFMLTETLVVSTLIIGVLLFLFVQFRGINQHYNTTFQYNAVETLYAADALRAFYYEDDYEGLEEYYRTNHLKFLDLTNCPDSVLEQTEYCHTIINKANIKQVIFTDADMTYIIGALDMGTLSVNPTMESYIRAIPNDEAGVLLKYRLIVELNDGTFGNIKIDNANPDMQFVVVEGEAGTNHWYISPDGIKVKMVPVVGTSGLKEYYYCTTTAESCVPNTHVAGKAPTIVSFTNPVETNKICVIMYSKSGSVTEKCSDNYKIDKTTPDATFTVTSGTSGNDGWYKSGINVKITPSAGNSGLKEYYYCTTTGETCTPNTKVTGDTETTVTLNAQSATNKVCVVLSSNSGATNVKCSDNYKIDSSTPDATFTVTSGTSGSNGWYKSGINVKITPSAGSSSVKNYYYCTTTDASCTPTTEITGAAETILPISTQSSTNKICITVNSNSGGTNTKCSGNYKIDTQAPTLTVAGNTSDFSATYGAGTYSAPATSATDNLTASPTITSSGTVNGSTVGTYTVVYTATDEAGNSTSLTMTVSIINPCQGLSVNFYVNWTGKYNGNGYNECDIYINGTRVAHDWDCEGSYTVTRNVNGCNVSVRTKYNGHDEGTSGRPNVCDVYFNGTQIASNGNCEYLNYTRTLSG